MPRKQLKFSINSSCWGRRMLIAACSVNKYLQQREQKNGKRINMHLRDASCSLLICSFKAEVSAVACSLLLSSHFLNGMQGQCVKFEKEREREKMSREMNVRSSYELYVHSPKQASKTVLRSCLPHTRRCEQQQAGHLNSESFSRLSLHTFFLGQSCPISLSLSFFFSLFLSLIHPSTLN